MNSYTHDSLTK